MENDFDCSTIREHLSNCQLVAPCYFILCGLKRDECQIIVRDRESCQLYPMIDDQLVQTNIDPEPETWSRDILYSRQRKSVASQIIHEIQQNASASSDVFINFAVNPIINEETVYMCMMIPFVGYLKVITT
jgi:hypothetical protein